MMFSPVRLTASLGLAWAYASQQAAALATRLGLGPLGIRAFMPRAVCRMVDADLKRMETMVRRILFLAADVVAAIPPSRPPTRPPRRVARYGRRRRTVRCQTACATPVSCARFPPDGIKPVTRAEGLSAGCPPGCPFVCT